MDSEAPHSERDVEQYTMKQSSFKEKKHTNSCSMTYGSINFTSEETAII
jgi:hypothetical protein